MIGRRGSISGQEVVVPNVSEGAYGQAYADLFAAFYQGLAFSGGANKVQALKSSTANPATTGILRLARTDELHWRNAANTADVAMGVNSSNHLTWRGQTVTYAPTVIATIAASQTIGTTFVTVVWDTTTVNSGTMLNTGTGQVTVPIDGLYLVSTRLLENKPVGVNNFEVKVTMSGTSVMFGSRGNTTADYILFPQVSMARIVRLNANDTLLVQARNTISSTLTGSTNQNQLVVRWLSA
jgi:hypothetical protein